MKIRCLWVPLLKGFYSFVSKTVVIADVVMVLLLPESCILCESMLIRSFFGELSGMVKNLSAIKRENLIKEGSPLLHGCCQMALSSRLCQVQIGLDNPS